MAQDVRESRGRWIVHLTGPSGAGKTTLARQLVAGNRSRAIAVLHSAPAGGTHDGDAADLALLRDAGAIFAEQMLWRPDAEADDLESADFWEEFWDVLLVEGPLPPGLDADLVVFVTAAPRAVGPICVQQSHTDDDHPDLLLLRSLLDAGHEPREVLRQVLRRSFGPALDAVTDEVLAKVATARSATCPAAASKRRLRWRVASPWQGIERASVVVVNARTAAQAERGRQFVASWQAARLEPDIARDLSAVGGRRPVTAVVGNLQDPRDAAVRSVAAKIRRLR